MSIIESQGDEIFNVSHLPLDEGCRIGARRVCLRRSSGKPAGPVAGKAKRLVKKMPDGSK